MEELFDVVVVGGGMVGAALACALGGADLRVAVVEQAMPPPFSPDQPHDLRVSALSMASRRILEAVGAWPHLEAGRLCPFSRMRVWESTGAVEFCSADIGQPELGYIAENRLTQLALLAAMARLANVALFCPARIAAVDYQPGQPTAVGLDDGRRLLARLLVAADGGQSAVRQAVGLGVSSWDYPQQALVLYVRTGYGQQDITWQRFVASGPQAFLPLTGPYASLVWYHHPDEVRRLRALPLAALRAELERAFPAQLGQVAEVLAVASFPLRRQHAHAYVKQGVALVGDAAHMINPLAGQGVNIGLLDAAALAEVVVEAAGMGRQIADALVLKRYERMRRLDNLGMMTAMDLFYHAFSNEIWPLKLLRNLGLGVADRVPVAKKQVMRSAMGLDGNLPKLARGLPLG